MVELMESTPQLHLQVHHRALSSGLSTPATLVQLMKGTTSIHVHGRSPARPRTSAYPASLRDS
jgi:hypothetical protein